MLARLFPHCASVAQRIGNAGGGALLFQSVLTSPMLSSWNDTVPMLTGADEGLPSSFVVHASWKAVLGVPAAGAATVTFSFVGVVL